MYVNYATWEKLNRYGDITTSLQRRRIRFFDGYVGVATEWGIMYVDDSGSEEQKNALLVPCALQVKKANRSGIPARVYIENDVIKHSVWYGVEQLDPCKNIPAEASEIPKKCDIDCSWRLDNNFVGAYNACNNVANHTKYVSWHNLIAITADAMYGTSGHMLCEAAFKLPSAYAEYVHTLETQQDNITDSIKRSFTHIYKALIPPDLLDRYIRGASIGAYLTDRYSLITRIIGNGITCDVSHDNRIPDMLKIIAACRKDITFDNTIVLSAKACKEVSAMIKDTLAYSKRIVKDYTEDQKSTDNYKNNVNDVLVHITDGGIHCLINYKGCISDINYNLDIKDVEITFRVSTDALLAMLKYNIAKILLCAANGKYIGYRTENNDRTMLLCTMKEE